MLRQRAIQAEDKEERRNAILCAAQHLLGRHGDRMPAVAEVAHEAGLAKGTVYLYFASKEELFLALHERTVAGFFAEFTRLLERCEPVEFADVFAATRRHLVDVPSFLPLACRCFAMLQKEIPAEVAVRFHERLGERLLLAGDRLEQRFGLPAGEGVVLLRHSYALIIGLWQMTAAHGVGVDRSRGGERRAAAVSPRPTFDWDYATELQQALHALWAGRLGAGVPG